MKRVLLFSGLLLLAACAATSTEQPMSVEEHLDLMGLQLGEGDARIPSYRVNGWNRIDDRNLVIISGVNDHYLVELRAPCPELEFAFGIGFTTTGIDRLDRFGDIILRGPGGRRERCAIRDIYELTPY